MKSFDLIDGRTIRIIRQEDEEERGLLKTKIVATLGRPPSSTKESTYKNGIFDLEGATIEPLTYERLVQEFYHMGVDVIRLNLSHLEVGEIRDAFKQIKTAILKCERGKKKQIALLADLPGPKIRFQLTHPITFRINQSFTIQLQEKVLRANEATVYVDGEPLKKALSKDFHDIDAQTPRIRSDQDSQYVENVLGELFIASRKEIKDPFKVMIEQIKAKTGFRGRAEERVLAVIGDGDVIMEVKAVDGADASKLLCKVISLKGTETRGSKQAGDAACTLSGNRGFTLKGIDFNIQSFTTDDEKKLDALLKAEYEGFRKPGWSPVVGFIAVSFTQTADDILRAQEHIEIRLRPYWEAPKPTRLNAPSLIAKIETEKGWNNKHFILDVADGVMVARGDLGLQMDIERVPAIQKRLIRLCNKRGKPVITATEMLKSMTDSIEPTRAEGTDVFNAIFEGSDAVMLSAETSKGKYPLNTLQKMIGIAVEAEQYFERWDMSYDLRRRTNRLRFEEFLKDDFERIKDNKKRFEEIIKVLADGVSALAGVNLEQVRIEKEQVKLQWRHDLYQEKLNKAKQQQATNRITQATCTLSEGDNVKCILAASTSGRTVRMISRLRPSVLLIGAAHDQINMRKLIVSYGVLPICIDEVRARDGSDGVFRSFRSKLTEDPFLNNNLRLGDTVIFTAGTPLRKPGTTNLIQMRTIEALPKKPVKLKP